jgi:hypothetical protein
MMINATKWENGPLARGINNGTMPELLRPLHHGLPLYINRCNVRITLVIALLIGINNAY